MSLSPCDGRHFGGQISIVHNAVEDIYSLFYKDTWS